MKNAATKMLVRSIRIDRCQIGYVKWLLESHDGMATPTTREDEDNVLDLLVAPDFAEDLDALLTALTDEISLVHVAPPLVPPLGG